MRFSKDGNKNVYLQYVIFCKEEKTQLVHTTALRMCKKTETQKSHNKEEETQLVFMAQLKAYNVIPLHLECAKTKQKKKQTNKQQQQQNYNQKKKKKKKKKR